MDNEDICFRRAFPFRPRFVRALISRVNAQREHLFSSGLPRSTTVRSFGCRVVASTGNENIRIRRAFSVRRLARSSAESACAFGAVAASLLEPAPRARPFWHRPAPRRRRVAALWLPRRRSPASPLHWARATSAPASAKPSRARSVCARSLARRCPPSSRSEILSSPLRSGVLLCARCLPSRSKASRARSVRGRRRRPRNRARFRRRARPDRRARRA